MDRLIISEQDSLKIFDMYSEEDLDLCFKEVFYWGDGYYRHLRDFCHGHAIDADSPRGQAISGLLLPFDQIPLHINTNSSYLPTVLRMRLNGKIKELKKGT